MFHWSGLRHHYVLLQPETSCTVSEQENHQPACCTQSRRVLQQTASLPSRNSAKEQEVTNHLRAPFQGIFMPNLRLHLCFSRNFWNYFMMDWKLHTIQKIIALYCWSCSQCLQWKTPAPMQWYTVLWSVPSVQEEAVLCTISKKPKPSCLMQTFALDPQYSAVQHLNPICLLKQQQRKYPRCLHNAFGEHQKHHSHSHENWMGSAWTTQKIKLTGSVKSPDSKRKSNMFY